MKTETTSIDLSRLSDASLKTTARNIMSTLAGNNHSSYLFSLKDATKAISNFNYAAAKAKNGDRTAVDIKNLTREALVAVLSHLCVQIGFDKVNTGVASSLS